MSSLVAQCPICDASVSLPADALMAELIACPECGCGLEITNLDPPRLAEAPSEEEDWGQ